MRKQMALLLLTFLLISLGGCNCGDAKDKVVTINSSGNYIVAPLVIMKEEKLLEKYLPEGYTVNWTAINTSTEIRDGMLTGDINISAPAMTTVISSLENGMPFRILSYMATPVYEMFSNDDRIQGISDIGEDDRISITGYTGSMHITFLAYCKEHLGDANALSKNLVVMPYSDALIALDSKSSLSVSIFQFSANLAARQKPALHSIADLTETAKKYGVGQVCVTTEEYFKDHPEVIEAFLQAQEDAIEMFNSQPDYVADLLINSGIQISKDDLLEEMQISELSGILREEQYNTLAQFMYEIQILEREPKKLSEYPFYESIMKNNQRYE